MLMLCLFVAGIVSGIFGMALLQAAGRETPKFSAE